MSEKDLEKENAELKDKLNNLASVAEVRLANWQKYEKENAELEKKVKILEGTMNLHEGILWNDLHKLEAKNKALKRKCENLQKYLDTQNSYRECAETWVKLTEAKEIINTMLGFMQTFGYSPSMDKFIAEAEQFLKEEIK